MKIGRRRFLQSGAILGAGILLHRDFRHLKAKPMSQVTSIPLTGNIRPVHDPVIIKAHDDNAYYLYCTGQFVEARRSEDLHEWRQRRTTFSRMPDWSREFVPASSSIWAPDISFYNDKYHLYYSISTFGSNNSVIGLATNTTLDERADGYRWEDQGLVVRSRPTYNYNAIDPNLVIDADGVPWLSFGSFWSGIKMIRLDYETGKPFTEDETLYSLSNRQVESGSVEAPFIIRRGDFYYLFVSFDFCCRGADSTYRVMVGRSESVTGPYVDRDGVPMLEGGGTQVTFPTERWKGPGHNSILQDNGVDYLVYHAYDAHANGTPTLHIDPLLWDEDGWPLPVSPADEAE